MASYSTSEFKAGLKVLIDNEPCHILENEFVKPDKGQAFNRVKYRNLLTMRVNEKTFKSGLSLPAADVVETTLQYLYHDDDFYYFMHPESYEQIQAPSLSVDQAKLWIKPEDLCTVILWDAKPLLVTAPNFVELAVIDTDPGLRGDTSGGGSKPATLETQAIVRVPLFIQIGDVLKIDTRTQSYVSRAKQS